MGFLIRLCLALVTALAIGVGSAFWMLGGVPQSSFIENGAWRIAPRPVHGFYERAALAQRDLLAPDTRDALTLTATTDESGAPLRGACSYRIEATSLPAQGWSLAAYGPHSRLLPASSQPRAAAGGGVDFKMAAHTERAFTLTLRLYRPDPRALAAPGAFNAPRIVKERCP